MSTDEQVTGTTPVAASDEATTSRHHRVSPIDGGATVNDETTAGEQGSSLISRRNLLRAGVVGAAGVGIAGVAGTRGMQASAAPAYVGPGPKQFVHLVATDGWVSMPTSAPPVPSYWPDELAPAPYNMYVFGFRNVTGMADNDVVAQRGQAQISAPVLSFDQDREVEVHLTNLGLSQRPDLIDGHTLHWHGFNNAIPIFDGVPEMSASVPIGKTLVYYYRPHDPGTYMYHCHFEDVEHVQMGMTGLIFVRPRLNFDSHGVQKTKSVTMADGHTQKTALVRYVFNDPATAYDREFAIFLTENVPEDHWRDAHIQISDWSYYKPGFSLFNGRAFPDTIEPSVPDYNPATTKALPPANDGSSLERLRYQPRSARMDVNAGETVLIRLAHLGSVRHTISVDGIPLRVIGADASQLVGADGTDNSYVTNAVDCAPGESRDILFTAPTKEGTYLVYDRNFMNLSNNGDGGYGGMLTHLVVHPAGTLDPQAIDPQTAV